jgi:biotin-(acetyl-CoA carboxylase) ligase
VGRNDVGACCVAAVTTALDEYASRDAREVVEAWREVDAWRGVTLTFSHGGGRVAGQVDGIDPDGSLRLITPDGLRRFAAGELHLDPQ